MSLIDVADRAAAAADLDGQARGRIDSELKYGDAEYALSIAVLETRAPLPADLLAQIRASVTDWYADDIGALILDAIDRQQQRVAPPRECD